MNSHSERLKKEIQRIIYQDLDVWKQNINDLEAKKMDRNSFKQKYVEFLQKIEENITSFTDFFLKKESHAVANRILEDNLEKTALLQTAMEFLSEPAKEKNIVVEIPKEKEEIIHRKFQPSVSSSPMKKEQQLLYPASEME